MRISGWSSDVCSSDLRAPEITIGFAGGKPIGQVMENFTFPDIERHVIWIALPDRHAEDVAGAQVFCPPRRDHLKPFAFVAGADEIDLVTLPVDWSSVVSDVNTEHLGIVPTE